MVRTRRAAVQDAAAINDITHRAFLLYAEELDNNTPVKALQESVQTVQNDIEKHAVFVAEEDGVLMGSLRIKQIGKDLAYLYRFGVDPHVRNAGVGSALLQAAIDYCTDRDFAAIVLHTNAKYYKLARYYYGKKFYVHSTSDKKGYIRALFVKELAPRPFDISPAFDE